MAEWHRERASAKELSVMDLQSLSLLRWQRNCSGNECSLEGGEDVVEGKVLN